MDNDPIKTHTLADSRRSLHVLDKSSDHDELRSDQSGTWRKIWIGLVVIALCLSCVICLVVNKKRADIIRPPSPQRDRIKALAEQLASLKQTDLIVFPDGRVWFVRAVHGRNMEVVGSIGDNTRSENIDSFVLREDKFTIVRHLDPGWQMQRDRFLDQ